MPDCFSKSEVTDFLNFMKLPDGTSVVSDDLMEYLMAYEAAFNVTHSDCYLKYGLRRTGCACCPFGKDFEAELVAAEKYEPNLHRAALHVFGKSYEYTRKYREYQEQREKENKNENH